MVFGYRAAASLGWEGKRDSGGGKATGLKSNGFIYVGLCENYVFPAQIHTLPHMKEKTQ